VALTDHDTAGGWVEAVAAASTYGVELVRGMEVSTRHRGEGVHLLAYLLDPTHPDVVAQLDRVLAGRGDRIPAMVAALRAAGSEITEADVQGGVRGRPHVADALVRLGEVGSRDEAFARWLDPGRPGYVDRYAAPLTSMITAVAAAGGVTVLAHPWARGRRDALPVSEIERLARLGLAGIEVDHQEHDAAARAELRAVAAGLDLGATGSSDHHGLGKVGHDLGCCTTAPEEYARLLARAEAAATASGRPTPGVVRP
jgi:3',5'-nucleoside bisphosphate phosphatase